jgi:hypothetical protein
MMNKKRILLAVSFVFFCFVSYAQAKSENKETQIDTNDFYNSAHHWYDIYESKNVINPEPNQPRYKPTQITERQWRLAQKLRYAGNINPRTGRQGS